MKVWGSAPARDTANARITLCIRVLGTVTTRNSAATNFAARIFWLAKFLPAEFS